MDKMQNEYQLFNDAVKRSKERILIVEFIHDHHTSCVHLHMTKAQALDLASSVRDHWDITTADTLYIGSKNSLNNLTCI